MVLEIREIRRWGAWFPCCCSRGLGTELPLAAKKLYHRYLAESQMRLCSVYIRDKVFKNGPSKTCGRQPLKNLKRYDLLKICFSWPYHFKFFKGCLPQILLSPFLNTLSHIFGWNSWVLYFGNSTIYVISSFWRLIIPSAYCKNINRDRIYWTPVRKRKMPTFTELKLL